MKALIGVMDTVAWVSLVLGVISFIWLVIDCIRNHGLKIWEYIEETYDMETGEIISTREITKEEYEGSKLSRVSR